MKEAEEALKDSEFAAIEPIVVFEKKRREFSVLSWKNPDDRDEIIKEYENPYLAKHSWEQQFGDSLPEDDYTIWTVWHTALDEIKKAQSEKTLLGSNLIAAGVFHPHRLVAREIGLSQTLTQDQLEFLLQRLDLRPDDKMLISFFQQSKIPQGSQV